MTSTDSATHELVEKTKRDLAEKLEAEVALTKKNAKSHCRCKVPVIRKIEQTACHACLKPLDLESWKRADEAGRTGKKTTYGTSAHRQPRVEKFLAAQKRKKEKRARAKRNARRK